MAGKGFIVLKVTDKLPSLFPAFAPSTNTTPFSKVDVTITLVKVHKAGTKGGSQEENGSDMGNDTEKEATETNDTNEIEGDGEGQWITVVNTPQDFDLLSLVNNPATLLESTNALPDGTYTQIRINISKGTVTFADAGATVMNLTVPSQRLYWVRTFTIANGKTTTLTLDFNATKSITCDSQGCILKPVARITEE